MTDNLQFIKPRGKVDYPELGFEAGVKAMLDAHINYDDVDQGVACYCYGDSTCGQRVFYQFGMTGIPVYNVNNNCSTGSTGLYMGRNMIAHGAADCVLVVGFEKMFPGSLQTFFQDRTNPTATTNLIMKETRGITNAPGAAQLFGNAGREHMEKYASSPTPSMPCYFMLMQTQIRLRAQRLCRNRPRQPRPQQEQPLLPIPRRIHPRPSHQVAHDPRAPHQTPMLPDL